MDPPFSEVRLRKNQRRLRFLKSLGQDLRIIGHDLSVRVERNQLVVRHSQDGRKDAAQRTHRRIRQHALWHSRDELRALERDLEHCLQFADPRTVSVDRVLPSIVICRTSEEERLFDYLRRFQTVLSNPCVGARLKAIVYDTGQDGPPRLLGIIAIGSAMYFQGARDRYLNWVNPGTGEEAKRVRESGLRQCLHISICMALPPYDALRAGRLVAMLCFSNVIRDAFAEKYRRAFVALTVGASMQPYAVIFDRLQMRELHDAAGKPHLFRKLPRREPSYRYATNVISAKTYEAAAAFMPGPSDTQSQSARSRARIQDRSLRHAMTDCGLPFDILKCNETATYLGAVREDYVERLRSGNLPDEVDSLVADRILQYWTARFAEGARRAQATNRLIKPRLLSRGLRNPHRR